MWTRADAVVAEAAAAPAQDTLAGGGQRGREGGKCAQVAKSAGWRGQAEVAGGQAHGQANGWGSGWWWGNRSGGVDGRRLGAPAEVWTLTEAHRAGGREAR